MSLFIILKWGGGKGLRLPYLGINGRLATWAWLVACVGDVVELNNLQRKMTEGGGRVGERER